MAIDFHDEKNKMTYASRKANASWSEDLEALLPPGKHFTRAADIGCGGGIYSKALIDAGVESVVGVDFSKAMLEGAKANCEDYDTISFQLGSAFETGLADAKFDLVLARALIHHLGDLQLFFTEAHRILEKDGYFIVQDRTPEDVLLPGSQEHIRGYFFEKFIKLKTTETQRRHRGEEVRKVLEETGFKLVKEVPFWEVRGTYPSKNRLKEELRHRIGRSILYELDDFELEELIDYIDSKVTEERNIVEKDRWTMWIAQKK